MLTKEEYLKALDELWHSANNDAIMNGDVLEEKHHEVLEQLIEEHFYIPPIITAFKVYSDSTFQSFTKKELIEYIHTIYHNWKNACIVNERVIKMNYKLQSEIDELKSNPPLDFEELKEDMLVWDKITKEWIQIIEKYDHKLINRRVGIEEEIHTNYCPIRFYRKEVQE